MSLQLLDKRPILAERDLHHCCCCSPPQRTIVTDVLAGMGAGYPQFTCPKTRISFRYSEGAESYIGGHITLPGSTHYNETLLGNLWQRLQRSLRRHSEPGPDSSYAARIRARRGLQ